MSAHSFLSCCYSRRTEDEVYTDLISRIPETPFPIFTHPPVGDVPPQDQTKTLRMRTKGHALAAQALLLTSNFVNLSQLEVGLTTSINVAAIDSSLRYLPNLLRTLCLRCVAPEILERASESDDDVRYSLSCLFEHFTHLSCLSISVSSRNAATSPNDYIPKYISTQLNTQSLRVLKLSFSRFEGLGLHFCVLDIHTIELDEIETDNIQYSPDLEKVILSNMTKLVKVVVRTPRTLLLADDNPSLRKLVLCNVRDVQGDVANVCVLNLANVDVGLVNSLVDSAALSLEELGVYSPWNTPLTLRLSTASKLKAVYLQRLPLARLLTPNESPLQTLCMRSVKVTDPHLAICAKQVLLVGDREEILSALRHVHGESVRNLVIEAYPEYPNPIPDDLAIMEALQRLRDQLVVFGTNIVLPNNFPPLKNVTKLACRSVACLKKVHRNRAKCRLCSSSCLGICDDNNKLDLLSLQGESADTLNDEVCVKKSKEQRFYTSVRHFWYEALEKESSLITDTIWNDSGLKSLWQWLLPAEQQAKLFGHGPLTRSSSIAEEADMEEK